ncbi:MAG: hypothetical protein K2X29_05430 [Candidatus Obscuribacterales bacterium]|nr:hypothetical protein [Candidatus Obscuribacterales bacterium]
MNKLKLYNPDDTDTPAIALDSLRWTNSDDIDTIAAIVWESLSEADREALEGVMITIDPIPLDSE